MKRITYGFAAIMFFFLLTVLPVHAQGKDDGFKPLFNGKDFTGFGFSKPGVEKAFSVKDGVIDVAGRPAGYIVTKKSYRNYILKVEFRYPKNAGNSGYLIHIQGPPKGTWPKCIEVQGQYGGVCMIFPIQGAKGKRPPVDSKTRNKVRKPHTEWNEVKIVSKNGHLTSYLNGAKICETKEPFSLKEGPIGFQSEGAPIQFRKMTIKVME